MYDNPLTDLEEKARQDKMTKILEDFTEELRKVNAKLDEIEGLLKKSDKTYIG